LKDKNDPTAVTTPKSLNSIYRVKVTKGNTVISGWPNIYVRKTELAFMVTYMRTGRKSSAPGGLASDAIETFNSKLLMTLQQLRMHVSLSLGDL